MMKIFSLSFRVYGLVLLPCWLAGQGAGVSFSNLPSGDIDVAMDGKPFTQYLISRNAEIKKPVLFPLITQEGKTLTRGFPVAPRAGERTDHPHHVGLWLNYGKVNGVDYWNNSPESLASGDPAKYGMVAHRSVAAMIPGERGELRVTAAWLEADGKGKQVLEERTMYHFGRHPLGRYIDRETILEALVDTVYFKDDKEGMLAIRVARTLEHPSNRPDLFTDAQGRETKVPTLDNTGVTGEYLSSEGIRGEAVWSTRARWMRLGGQVEGQPVAITLFDHPGNVGYPTYWHARGYGLFSANPLGAEIFSKGKEHLHLVLRKGETLRFRYRVILSDSIPGEEVLELEARQFGEKP